MGIHKPNVTLPDLTQYFQEVGILTPKITAAITQAIETHKNDIRDDGTSYLEQHIFPTTVSFCLYVAQKEREEAAILSLLHDVLEDDERDEVMQSMRTEFGNDVVHDLLALRKERHQNKAYGERTQDDKHLEHKVFVERLQKERKLLQIIKLLDRINNLMCTEISLNPSKYKRFLKDTREFYLPLAQKVDIFLEEKIQRELERLEKP